MLCHVMQNTESRRVSVTTVRSRIQVQQHLRKHMLPESSPRTSLKRIFHALYKCLPLLLPSTPPHSKYISPFASLPGQNPNSRSRYSGSQAIETHLNQLISFRAAFDGCSFSSKTAGVCGCFSFGCRISGFHSSFSGDCSVVR